MPKKQLMPLLNELRRAPAESTRRMTWGFATDQVLLIVGGTAGLILLTAWIWWMRGHAQI
ncbi:MAG: hypothetical protein ACREJD_07805 [Phycisphaerales bacterium]